MTEKTLEYLTDKIRYLQDSFPGLVLQYTYHENMGRHVVEASPEDIFIKNNEYKTEEIKIKREFEKMFGERIYFISNKSNT